MLPKLHRAITHGTIRGVGMGQGAGGPYVIQRGSGELFITLTVPSPAPYILHYSSAPYTLYTGPIYRNTALSNQHHISLHLPPLSDRILSFGEI